MIWADGETLGLGYGGKSSENEVGPSDRRKADSLASLDEST